jgi:hypothetical protein
MSASVLAGVLCVLGVLSSAAWAQDFGRSSADWFHVSWEPRAYGTTPSIEGYVHNATLYRVSNVRLRIEGLDAEHRLVGQVFVWTFGDIGPGDRAYFVATVVRGATTYRITVASFDVVSRGGS